MMLKVGGIDVAYGPVQVLRGVSLELNAGEVLCLLGRNGAGKTTTLKAIMGLLPLGAGQITLREEEISRLPAHEVPRRGIGYVPQGRRLFSELTVAQNLQVGMMTRRSAPEVLDEVLALFPRLGDRMGQRADTLSGGEQQMLAMGRALCIRPDILLLDEPTEGLQPSMIQAIRDVIEALRRKGTAVLLVEQRIDAVLAIADRATFLENGRTIETLTAAQLRAAPDVLRKRLGV
jgi:branched-chain amino acid transport system ATP-binding protein